MVILKDRFKKEFRAIFDFIAQDSENRAYEFMNELLNKFELIEDSPYAFRKSTKFDDDNIRDFIFKGYVIPYLVDDDIVLILGIYKSNEWSKN